MAAADRAPGPPPSVSDAVITAATEGMAVLDAERRCVWLNPAGARILGATQRDLLGRQLFPPAPDEVQWVEWAVSADGADYVSVLFHEGDRHDRHRRKLASFARTAARIALVGSVEDVLDRVAEEARESTGARACSIILRDGDGFDANLVGIAGHDSSYLGRLLKGLHQGAPLATLEAFQTGRPARRRKLQQLIRAEPGYGALVETAAHAGWSDLIAVPMIVKDETLGVLTSFYDDGQSPSEEDSAFLMAMADQCGVAVYISRLFAEAQSAAAAEQRHRWAHDLHDSVSQSLFSLVLQTRALRLASRRSAGGDDGRIERGLLRLESLAEGLQAEMRTLMTELQPGVEGEPLTLAVTRLATEIREQTGLDVVLDLPAREPDLTDFARSEVFRVVREAVHNSVRHADATLLTIRVHGAVEGTLGVMISDDGRGFDARRANPGHLGLWSMRERIARLGGTCEIDSSSEGTSVSITVPVTGNQWRGGAGARR